MPSPLTESLVLHWPPTVRYHRHRLDVLDELKADGLLKEFQITPEWVGVRTAVTQVTMDEDQIALHPRGPLLSGDGGDTRQVLRSALRCALPSHYRLTLPLQFLIPIENHSYDAARVAVLSRMSLGAPLAVSDFSMLVEGRVDHADWHCEFGIVSEEEVKPRLRRRVGRMRSFGGEVPPFVEVDHEIAPVSFFADVIWHVSEQEVPDGDVDQAVDDIIHCVERLGAEADQIVSTIAGRLCEDSLQPVAGGANSE